MPAIRFERDGAVGRIILANPPFNRLDADFLVYLRQAVHAAGESDIRVLVIAADGPHFSFGGEVRGTRGRDANWFRTYVAEISSSYREIESLRVPTVAVVHGFAFGGGFELALCCDFLVVAEDAVLRCVEVGSGMVPVAGAVQRLADRVGRSRASRYAMLGEPISGVEAGKLGIASHVVAGVGLESTAQSLIKHLANGPTRSYTATRTLLKAWSSGGVALADSMMPDIAANLYGTEDATRGFANAADALDRGIEPAPIIFNGR